MTKQKREGATTRETLSEYRGRPVVAEIHAWYLAVRLKGARTGGCYTISWPALLDWLEMRDAKAKNGDIPPRPQKKGR